MTVPQSAPEVRPAGPSGRRSKAAPDAASAAVMWDLRADPYVRAEFPAEAVMITVGVTFMADVRGMVPEGDAARFWAAFWNGLADTIEDTLRASLGAVPASGLEAARETARQMLAERFALVTRTAA